MNEYSEMTCTCYVGSAGVVVVVVVVAAAAAVVVAVNVEPE